MCIGCLIKDLALGQSKRIVTFIPAIMHQWPVKDKCSVVLTWNFVDGSKRSQNSECPYDSKIVATLYCFLNQAGNCRNKKQQTASVSMHLTC